MFRMWMAAVTAAVLALTGAGAVGATERYEDPVGDATGAAPDIVAVTVSEPGNRSVVSISVEFASEPPLGSDLETWTDVLFVGMGPDAEAVVAQDAEYTVGTHGATLSRALDEGGILLTPEGMYWHVVDVAVDGPTITFSVDRKLIGSPLDLYWQVLVAVEREDETGEDEEEYDLCPDEGEPPGLYQIGKSGV